MKKRLTHFRNLLVLGKVEEATEFSKGFSSKEIDDAKAVIKEVESMYERFRKEDAERSSKKKGV